MIPNKISIHCSSTPNFKSVSIETIRQDHIKNRGFTDIGYHWVVNIDGKVEEGRREDTVGAHVAKANVGNIGICLIGTDKYTIPQLKALMALVKTILNRSKIPMYEVYTHAEFPSAKAQAKTCPNIRAANLVYWLATGDWSAMSKVIYGA